MKGRDATYCMPNRMTTTPHRPTWVVMNDLLSEYKIVCKAADKRSHRTTCVVCSMVHNNDDDGNELSKMCVRIYVQQLPKNPQ